MSKKPFDLAVAYRIYPKVSKTPALHPEDKLLLSERCLDSFVKSLGSLRVKVYVLLDGCPPEYEQLFRKFFAPDHLEIIHCPAIGNQATYKRQIEILSAQEDADTVYFAEDDYFYLDNALEEAFRVIQNPEVDFLSVYDHLDYYDHPLHQTYQSRIALFGNHHWRTAASTCLTFMAQKSTLLESAEMLQTFSEGNRDVSLWMSLTKTALFEHLKPKNPMPKEKPFVRHSKRAWKFSLKQHLFGKRYALWCPIPALATHLESKHLSPAIEWQQIWHKKI